MTFLKKFEAIKKKYEKADLTNLTESFAVQINLTDADCGGAFYIAYINDNFAVEPYDYHDHTAMITADAETFEGFIGGKKELADMEIAGNAEHVKAIALVLEKKKAAKKPAAKKKTAPKATTKKTQTAEAAEVKPEAVKAEEKKTEAKTPAKEAPVKKEAAKKTTKKTETK